MCFFSFFFSGGFQVRPEELKDMDNMRKRCPLEVRLQCTKTFTRGSGHFDGSSCQSGRASATRGKVRILLQRIFPTPLRTRCSRLIVPAARLQYHKKDCLPRLWTAHKGCSIACPPSALRIFSTECLLLRNSEVHLVTLRHMPATQHATSVGVSASSCFFTSMQGALRQFLLYPI